MREKIKCDICKVLHKGELCLKCEKKRVSALMREMFQSIWKTRPHYCVNCDDYLGSVINSCYFDHTLDKSKYPELTLVPENIMLLCSDCHGKKTNGFPSILIQIKIKELKIKFNIKK